MGDLPQDPPQNECKQEVEINPVDPIDPVQDTTCSDSSNFSLREYVFSSRTNGANHNWPFHHKHLEIFTRHGIINVLPPFEPPVVARFHSCKKDAVLSCSEEETVAASSIENPAVSISRGEQLTEFKDKTCVEEAIMDVSEQVFFLSISDDTNEHHNDKCAVDAETKLEVCESIMQHEMNDSIPKISSKAPNTSLPYKLIPSKKPKTRKGKPKRRKGKPKKRSLVDIYTEAKHITLNEIDMIHGSTWAIQHSECREITTVINEENKSINHNVQPEVPERTLERKHPRGENLCNNDFPKKKRCVIMHKPKGCNATMLERKSSSFGKDE